MRSICIFTKMHKILFWYKNLGVMKFLTRKILGETYTNIHSHINPDPNGTVISGVHITCRLPPPRYSGTAVTLSQSHVHHNHPTFS